MLFYTEVVRLFCVRQQDNFCSFEKGVGDEFHHRTITVTINA